jgi:hypothetical protein
VANLTETVQWHEHIYQLALTDRVKGGPDGKANVQPQQLAERTQFLRQGMETVQQHIAGLIDIEQLSQYSFVTDDPRRAMSTNMALSGLPSIANSDGSETILEDGDLLLLCGQANGMENGMWVVHTGAWARHHAFPTGSTSCFTHKFIVPQEGLFAGLCFYLKTHSYTVGETELTFLGSIFAAAAMPGKIPMFNRDGTIAGMEVPEEISNVTFTNLTADGDANHRTTKLTLTFAAEIPGLSAADIELTAGNTGAVKGGLTGTPTVGTYELVLSGISASGNITVSVAKQGFKIAPQSRETTIYYAAGTTVAASANGSDTITSTEITLTFTGDGGALMDITGLTATDITLGAGVTKGSLSHPSTGVYKLGVSGLTASRNISVSITKAGYDITPAAQNVYCHYAVPVTFNSATPNDSGGTTVSATLSFSATIPGLAATDFIVTANGTGATRGSLSGSGPNYVLTLDNVTASGTASIAVAKSGFAISGSPKSVTITKSSYNYNGVVDNTTMGGENLLTKLSAATVGDAIDILHTMINADGVSGFGNLHIGDYLDLPSITIAADNDAANEPTGTITNSTTYENLRLVIAGFNLWKGLNGNTKNHICFTFKQIPCKARYYTEHSTIDYLTTKLRAFLLDEFLTGLKTALGTTNKPDYHCTIVRNIDQASGADRTVQDELFLFTDYEVFGTVNVNTATISNQIHIPWFKNDPANRIKKYNGTADGWWDATVYFGNNSTGFCLVSGAGAFGYTYGYQIVCGCSPGFCLS